MIELSRLEKLRLMRIKEKLLLIKDAKHED